MYGTTNVVRGRLVSSSERWMGKSRVPLAKMERRAWLLVLTLLAATLLIPRNALALPPPNDRFQLAQVIKGVSGTASGSNVDATSQTGEPAHSDRGDRRTIWYRWRPATPLLATFSTQGSTPDTVLSVYTGLSLSTLTLIALNDDAAPGSGYSKAQFSTRPDLDYWIMIDGADNETGPIALSWTSIPRNDAFQSFELLATPSGHFEGDSSGASLQVGENPPVEADVDATVWFAWSSVVDGDVVFDTSGSSFDTVMQVYIGDELLGLTSVVQDDDSGATPGSSSVSFHAESGGRYRIVIGGRGGASGAYRLNWHQLLPPPANDNLGAAQRIVGTTGQVSGANDSASVEAEEPAVVGDEARLSVWFRWIAPRSGTVFFVAPSSFFPVRLTAFTGEIFEELHRVAQGVSTPPLDSDRLEFAATEGVEYMIGLDSRDAFGGAFTLQWNFNDLNSENNQFATARRLQGFNGVVSGENYYADLELGEPLHAGDPGARSVWYRWVAPASMRVRWTTQGSNFDTLLAVYTGENLETGLKTIAANDDFDQRTSSQVDFLTEAGTTYYIAVASATDFGLLVPSIGAISLRWSPISLNGLAFYPTKGMVGSRICIGAQELDGIESVTVGSVNAEFYVREGALYALIPPGASSGLVSVISKDWELSSTTDFVVIPGPPPALDIARTPAGGVRLSWLANPPELRVESGIDLRSSVSWEPAQEPNLVGDRFVLDLPPVDETPFRFFRLYVP